MWMCTIDITPVQSMVFALSDNFGKQPRLGNQKECPAELSRKYISFTFSVNYNRFKWDEWLSDLGMARPIKNKTRSRRSLKFNTYFPILLGHHLLSFKTGIVMNIRHVNSPCIFTQKNNVALIISGHLSSILFLSAKCSVQTTVGQQCHRTISPSPFLF